MHPGRVDVIGAGALVWDIIIREVAKRSRRGDALTVVSSEHDILDGIASSLADV
jgi:exopolyphosphatase/guanosine-5'-triphosphate,3'-diphosphate pyrophosphatase